MAEMRIIESTNQCEIPKSMKSSLCNICRNHKNIHDPSHRKSKVHQKKLNEKFCVIRAKMKDIKPSNIIIHDEDWNSDEAIFCYFCHKSIPKHALYDGITVEYLGYLNHLVSSSHQTEVIDYLKYHGRREDYKIFCKTQSFLKTFTDGIYEAKKKYEEKLDALNRKDVQKMKDLQATRKEILEYNFKEEENSSTTVSLLNSSNIKANSFDKDNKIPPWLISSAETSRPIIGPTLEILQSHLKKKKRKSLPPKRLQTHLNKNKSKINRKWLPPFSGVWNKGRSRKLKHEVKK